MPSVLRHAMARSLRARLDSRQSTAALASDQIRTVRECGGSSLLSEAALDDMPPHPKRQPQKRVEELQPLRQRHGQHVGLIGQMDVQFGQPIAPASAEKKGRETAAGRPKARIVRIELSLAGGHRVQRRRLQPANGRAFGECGHQSVGKGHLQKPPAKQEGLGGGAPRAPEFSGADQALHAILRGGRQQGVDIGKPFEPVPPVERAVYAKIGKEIFFDQPAKSRSPRQGYNSFVLPNRPLVADIVAV